MAHINTIKQPERNGCRLIQVEWEGNMFLLPVQTIAAVIVQQNIFEHS